MKGRERSERGQRAQKKQCTGAGGLSAAVGTGVGATVGAKLGAAVGTGVGAKVGARLGAEVTCVAGEMQHFSTRSLTAAPLSNTG